MVAIRLGEITRTETNPIQLDWRTTLRASKHSSLHETDDLALVTSP